MEMQWRLERTFLSLAFYGHTPVTCGVRAAALAISHQTLFGSNCKFTWISYHSSNITKETPLQHSTPPLSLDLLRAKHKLKNKGAFLQFVGHLSTDRMLLSKQATQLAATQVRFERVLVSKQSISDQTPFGNNCKLTGISNDLAISSRELSWLGERMFCPVIN